MVTVETVSKGFGDEAYDWFAGLALDNSRDFFQAHRAIYDGAVKGPFEELLRESAKEFGGVPKTFRPNRDTRFSVDKRPYKTNIGGYLEGAGAMCYLHVDGDGLMAATGYYMMANDQLARFRAALATVEEAAENEAELRGIIAAIEAEGLEVGGEGVKTAPKGFSKDHPAIDLLRRKSLTVSSVLSPDETEDPARCLAHAGHVWRTAKPLNAWLDRHVGPSEQGPGLAR